MTTTYFKLKRDRWKMVQNFVNCSERDFKMPTNNRITAGGLSGVGRVAGEGRMPSENGIAPQMCVRLGRWLKPRSAGEVWLACRRYENVACCGRSEHFIVGGTESSLFPTT
jgi:hypothetical protein